MLFSNVIVFSIVFFASANAALVPDVTSKADFVGYVDIAGHEYYLNTTRAGIGQAKRDCESRNMTMISFEGDEGGKWEAISSYVKANNLTDPPFWISADRLSGHKDWIWDYTGNVVQAQEFHWATPDFPMNTNDDIFDDYVFCILAAEADSYYGWIDVYSYSAAFTFCE